MKTIRYLLALLSCIYLFAFHTQCKDDNFLEESVYQLTTETAYQTQSQIELAINYLHNRMQYLTISQYQYKNYILTGMGLDTFTSTTPGTATSDWNNLTPNEIDYLPYWSFQLSQLNMYANTIIEACDKPEVKFANENLREQYKAEGLFFRAWAHRCLVGLFGDWAIVTQVYREAKFDYVRSSRTDVWLQCREDLDFAAKHLPVSTSKSGRIVRAAADHLLAEINICLGDHLNDKKYYTEAISAATRVIDGSDGDYALMKNRFGKRASEAGKDVYWDLFRAGNFNYQEGNKEAIWVVQYDYANAVGGTGGMPGSATSNKLLLEFAFQSMSYYADRKITDAQGKSVFFFGDGAVKFPDGKSSQTGSNERGVGTAQLRPTNYFLYDIWENSGDDYRNSEANIQRNIRQAGGKLWSDVFDEIKARGDWSKIIVNDTFRTVFPRIWKFSSDQHINGDPELYDADVYIMRLAETYLLRAEAYLKNGNKGLAKNDINEVRGRSKATLITDADVSMDYILDERARELFGEEYRLVTLTRLSTNDQPVLVDRVKKYGWKWPDLPNENRPNIKKYQWIYPIPQSVIDANSELKYPQNEGY